MTSNTISNLTENLKRFCTCIENYCVYMIKQVLVDQGVSHYTSMKFHKLNSLVHDGECWPLTLTLSEINSTLNLEETVVTPCRT